MLVGFGAFLNPRPTRMSALRKKAGFALGLTGFPNELALVSEAGIIPWPKGWAISVVVAHLLYTE
jgi:hypothetical protein